MRSTKSPNLELFSERTSYTHFIEPAKEESGDVVTIHRQHIPLNLPSGTCVHETSYTHFIELTKCGSKTSHTDLHDLKELAQWYNECGCNTLYIDSIAG